MTRKSKNILITIISTIMILTVILGFGMQNVFAFSGVPNTLSEKDLYNATNTYDVSESCFNNGTFVTTVDNNRITNQTEYNITYNMLQKNNNQVMNTAQITVLTHGLGSHAGVWSNTFV